MTNDLERAAAEIESLHAFFEGWMAGSLTDADESYQEGLLAHLDDRFTMVQPGGSLTEYADLARGMRGAHGSNTEFRIAISDVVLRARVGEILVVTYTEWQKHAKASKPANNGRRVTAVFRDVGDRLLWTHLHETWLPADEMAAGDYSF